MQPQRWNPVRRNKDVVNVWLQSRSLPARGEGMTLQPNIHTVGHADTGFLLRTEVLMPEEEKLVFDGLFRHLHAGDKCVNKVGRAYIDGH